jgi:hypothetical protein
MVRGSVTFHRAAKAGVWVRHSFRALRKNQSRAQPRQYQSMPICRSAAEVGGANYPSAIAFGLFRSQLERRPRTGERRVRQFRVAYRIAFLRAKNSTRDLQTRKPAIVPERPRRAPSASSRLLATRHLGIRLGDALFSDGLTALPEQRAPSLFASPLGLCCIVLDRLEFTNGLGQRNASRISRRCVFTQERGTGRFRSHDDWSVEWVTPRWMRVVADRLSQQRDLFGQVGKRQCPLLSSTVSRCSILVSRLAPGNRKK